MRRALIAATILGVSSSVVAQVSWQEIGSHSIARVNAPLVTDGGGNVWSFGGGHYGMDFSDGTRLLAGETWIEVPTPTVPPARNLHGMVFDVARNRIVMFGGVGPAGLLSDTWEFDGADWTQVASTWPQPRLGVAMAYDPLRAKTVLYGGESFSPGSPLGDTWEWDGVAWTLRTIPTSPGARAGAVAVYHAGLGQVVLYGGYNSPFPGGPPDVWGFDGFAWSIVAPPLQGHEEHAMAYDPVADALHVIGGLGVWKDHHVLQSGTWTQLPAMEYGLVDAAATYVSLTEGIVVTGSLGAAPSTRRYAGGAWSCVPSNWPTPRERTAMTTDTARGRVVLVGGSRSVDLLNDTWEWDGVMWSQRAIGAGPTPRQLHSFAFHEASGKSVLYGGLDAPFGSWTSDTWTSDTWTWDGTVWDDVAPPVEPPAVQSPALADDPVRGKLVAFGGYDGNSCRDETWEWDGVAWSQVVTAVSPSPRYGCSAAFDPTRGGVVLFGGGPCGGGVLGDTWLFDGFSWTQLAVTPPSTSLPQPELVWDPVRERLVVHSTESLVPFELSTWELVGSAWVERASPEFASGKLAFDPVTKRVLAFGHSLTGAMLWSYGADAPADVEPFGAGCLGSNGLALATVATNLPWLGGSFRAVVEGAAPGSIPFLVFGGSDQMWNGVPLPFDFGLFGATGCIAWNALRVPFSLQGMPPGYELSVPGQVSLVGSEWFVQGVAIDIAANPFGIVTGNALRLTVGER